MLIGHNRRLFIVYASLASIWVFLFQLCRLYTFSDPSSFFYDPHRAYVARYTNVREHQADELLDIAEHFPVEELAKTPLINNDSNAIPRTSEKPICVGIPSVKREREQFLPRAVASLVQGLSLEQRNSIHIIVLLADDEPTSNPAFGKRWLDGLADEVLFYGDASIADPSKRYHNVTSNNSHELSRNDRVHRDYATLITTCQERGAKYFALVEDDVIAAHNWLERLSTALDKLERTEDPKSWLYLRLFYSETYMGWNSEEWPTYLFHSMSFFSIVLVLYMLVLTVDARRKSQVLHLKASAWALPHLTIWTASFILLYFLAGRLAVDPYPTGVHEMPNYGCCAQGLVIPQQHLDALGTALRTASDAVAGDSLIESFADANKLKKYALTPSVLQHAGMRGSSDVGGIRKATWNFSFEKTNTRSRRYQ
ncbi:alpha-1 3-mannosyl-glyco 4-beta-n-acetylglucosaminyltransferase C [Fusarium beomiforme]|uniref:Alpha-1 3-mannosyl-glyco 4-beta-n-acetylglucosaminyltransferase C n=1 Tax=Fusarium beomiforme TaxID=44412 RepID=A0A9P5DYN2_9HYPO|nr:alpha-1 3-mannosyl-glyco 4-beta-n-acetylglucosaminyltransferase C [Fusarium beomiforme]